MSNQPKALLLSLPPEIREEIYRLLLHPDANRRYLQNDYTSYDYKLSLVVFRVNRQLYLESQKIFRDLNTFVRIETPWPEAQRHVALEGHVPIVVSNEKVLSFHAHSLSVCIDAPGHPSLDWDTQRFIILLDDLPKFTRMWFYADISHPDLNEHLRLKLQLRDPFAPAWEDKRLSKAMQRKMLLPFGEVKHLHSTEVGGEVKVYATIEQEMRESQSQSPKSPEHCLREATRLKFEGNSALKEGDYRLALKLYNEAWLAMHVVIKGRCRHIHGDAFFGRELREEPFVGKNGGTERLMLRVQLVANTCQVFLKMGEWEQCRFWGMRSISMLREQMVDDNQQSIPPQDEAILNFPAADQLGKIYYRTAVAYKMLEDTGEARKLLRVAKIYLPHDQSIQKEIAATALKLG